jgi:hypothetical protein
MHSVIQFSEEVMRHVAPLDVVQRRLETSLERSQRLYRAAFESGMNPPAEAIARVRAGFGDLCRSLDRLCETARHGRVPGHPEDLRQKLDHAFASARSALAGMDPVNFVRRVHHVEFHRSPGELTCSALGVVGAQIRRLVHLVAVVNPDVYEILLEGLVVAAWPVNEETLRPIA